MENNLTEVARVEIAPETMIKNTLSRKRKMELRQEAIVAFINSKPIGTRFRMRELIKAAGYDSDSVSQYQSGFTFVDRLTKNGTLKREKVPKSTAHHYWVIQQPQPISFKGAEEVDTTSGEPQEPVVELPIMEVPSDVTIKDVTELVSKAKQFAWDSNSDSLREFVGWLAGQE